VGQPRRSKSRSGLVEVTPVKLPAVLTGGSIATSASLQLVDVRASVAVGFFLTQLATFAIYAWSLARRQRQSQEAAIRLVSELADHRISIVVRTDGQLEITPAVDGGSSKSAGKSDGQVACRPPRAGIPRR
jgi:hypothetical protein